MKTKPRVIKDLEAVDQSIINDIIHKYPMGFAKHLVSFTGLKGKKVLALPYETDEKSYMLKITKARARAIMLTGAVDVDDQVFDIVEKDDAELPTELKAKKAKKKESVAN